MAAFAWLALALAVAQPAPAPPAAAPAPAAAPEPEPTEVAEVVVTARRIGVPVWRVGDGRSSVVFVGTAGSVPRDIAWNTTALEAAVAGSRKVLHTVSVSPTLGDAYRLLFRRGRYTDLPRGQSLETLTGPALDARLRDFAARDLLSNDYRRQRPWWVAGQLRGRLYRPRELRGGPSALEVAQRAARRARRPVQPVLQVRFNDVLRNAAQDRPEDLACLQASADAVDAGAEGVRARAQAWTRGRLDAIAATAISRADAVCWPEIDRATAPALRTAWRQAVRRELQQPGAVVAIAPLPFLVERGGLLDELQAQGYVVDGPSWR